MTQEVLVHVIFMLCSSYSIDPAVPTSNGGAVKELRIKCFEQYTNCAVGPNGKILTIQEFQQKCTKK